MRKLPRIGDRVIIPFGGREKEGEVVRVSRTLTPPRITVEIWLEGGDEPMLVTYPANWVRSAGAGLSRRDGVA